MKKLLLLIVPILMLSTTAVQAGIATLPFQGTIESTDFESNFIVIQEKQIKIINDVNITDKHGVHIGRESLLTNFLIEYDTVKIDNETFINKIRVLSTLPQELAN